LLSARYGRLPGMTAGDPKADLHRYLQAAREALLWKLAGLSEYDARRPLTPTGTNLLGLVKHLAGVEFWYFGDAFGRPPGESRDQIVGMYRRAWAHADETIAALDLDARGQVPWWPADRGDPTLHLVLVHVLAETHRHAGHADIVRELIDGAAGLGADDDNLRPGDLGSWERYRNQLERVAEQASRGPGA
jgi:Protein of unknown function (DUF664)